MAHEYAHTQGEKDEAIAEAVGKAAYRNYEAALGAACGGFR